MFQDKSLNLLKNIVILMGVILIVGVLVLFKLIATKIKDPAQSNCVDKEIQLNFDIIKNISTNDNKLFLHIVQDGQDKIVFFDYCNATEVNNITFSKRDKVD